MAANRPEPRAAVRTPRPIALSSERRALIEAEIAVLSATARRIAVELPLTADAGDFIVALEEAAGR